MFTPAGDALNSLRVSDAHSCEKECVNTEGCEYWTYYSRMYICLLASEAVFYMNHGTVVAGQITGQICLGKQYLVRPGSTCPEGSHPITSIEKCTVAAQELGFDLGGNLLANLDPAYVLQTTEHPEGCFVSSGGYDVWFNEGTSEGNEGNDQIFCEITTAEPTYFPTPSSHFDFSR